jgi:hypothetical protein
VLTRKVTDITFETNGTKYNDKITTMAPLLLQPAVKTGWEQDENLEKTIPNRRGPF